MSAVDLCSLFTVQKFLTGYGTPTTPWLLMPEFRMGEVLTKIYPPHNSANNHIDYFIATCDIKMNSVIFWYVSCADGMRTDVSEEIISSIFRPKIQQSKKSVCSRYTARHCIPEDGNIHNYRYENIKLCILYYIIVLQYSVVVKPLCYKPEGRGFEILLGGRIVQFS
jgi:hypothetical protein